MRKKYLTVRALYDLQKPGIEGEILQHYDLPVEDK